MNTIIVGETIVTTTGGGPEGMTIGGRGTTDVTTIDGATTDTTLDEDHPL
jgi:hypothetical protein